MTMLLFFNVWNMEIHNGSLEKEEGEEKGIGKSLKWLTQEQVNKILSWEEISEGEKLEMAKAIVVEKKLVTSHLEKILSWENISMEERFEIAKTLVSEKLLSILQKNMAIAYLSWEEVRLVLTAEDCKEPDSDIRKSLKILGAKDIKVSSDYPCYYGGENYVWTTTICFKYDGKL